MRTTYRAHRLACWQDAGVWQSTITTPSKQTLTYTWIAGDAAEVMTRLRAIVDEMLTPGE